MKKALVVGIDNYPTSPLQGCVNDALSVANVLERNGDGSPNFSVKRLTSNNEEVTCAALGTALEELFQVQSKAVETVLLYFAGHGLINKSGEGYLVAQDGKKNAWGIALSEVLALANKAAQSIQSTVIILDSCYSGTMGEVPALGSTGGAHISEGVTILTACHRSQAAQEYDGHGLFTGILIDSLSGSAADVCGRITPASIYSHVDQILGPWEQRPIYKANVHTFITLRQVTPKIPLEVLRALPQYFPNPADIFPLDPSFEPDRKNVAERIKQIPVNHDNAKIFKALQICNRHGLIVPDRADHMFDAAINSTGCKLTALGAYYRRLAEVKRI